MEKKEYNKMLDELFNVVIKYNTAGKISDLGCLAVATTFLGEIILGVHNGNIEKANAYVETPATKIALKKAMICSWNSKNAN